jgi:hypothetical protein
LKIFEKPISSKRNEKYHHIGRFEEIEECSLYLESIKLHENFRRSSHQSREVHSAETGLHEIIIIAK